MSGILGIDIGGTNLRIGLVDRGLGLPFGCEKLPSSRICGPEGPAAGLERLIAGFCAGRGIPGVDGVAIGIPGAVSRGGRVVYCTPNLYGADGRHLMEQLPLAEQLEQRLGIPVWVDKDVNNLLRWDVVRFGLKGTVAGCYIGTGLGGAIWQEGRILTGKDGVAMDAGHIPLFGSTRRCGCGKLGCAEAEASGVALERLREAEYPAETLDDLFRLHSQEPPVDRFLTACAQVPAILATVFNPDALVLGGGVVENRCFPQAAFRERILALTGRAVADREMDIRFSRPGPENGVLGAAAGMMQERGSAER